MQNETGGQRFLELQRYSEKLARLCHLTADIARLGDERTTLKKIVDTAATLLRVKGAHLALVDKQEQALYGVVSSGRHPQDAPRLKFQLSQSSAAQLALKRRLPIAIDNAADDSRVNPHARDLMTIRGVAYVPLLSGKQSFGLLILITRRPHTWTQAELDLATHLASVSAVALENSRLMTQLAETERRLRSLIEHIPAIIYICDVEPPYRTLYISPQTKEMLGYASQEWLDNNSFFMKIVHPDDIESLVNLGNEAVRTTGFSTAEYRLLDRQGEIRWFRDEAVLVRDLSGAPIAWHGVLVEITGSRKMRDH